MRINYSHLKSQLRRGINKRVGGYVSEAILYLTYIPRVKRTPLKKFVIFCFQRTGSTLLVNLLNSHPLIHCDGEIILNPMIAPRQYIDCRSKLSSKDVYGFKLQPHHFTNQKIQDPYRFIRDLLNDGYQIITLKRRDLFRSALSLFYAIQSGKFHYKEMSGERLFEKLIIDPEILLKKIEWIEQNSELLEKCINNYPHLELVYEDHLANTFTHQTSVNLIADYLNIPHSVVNTNLIKLMPDDYSAFIANASEINEFIKASKYAKYLNQNLSENS